MAKISESTVLQMERTRAKLEQKLKDRKIYVEEGTSLNELVNKVEMIGENDLLYNFINGNLTEFKLLDSTVNTLSSLYCFSPITTSIVKLYLPYIEKLAGLFTTNPGATQLLNLYVPNLKVATEHYSLGSMSKIINIIAPNFTTSPMGDFGLCTGNASMKRCIIPKYKAGSTAKLSNGLPQLEIIDVNRFITGGSYPLLKTLIIRNTTDISIMTGANSLPSNVEIYVPQSMIETYQNGTNWSAYTDNYIPLEGSKYESLTWYENEDWYLEEMSVWQ